MFFMKSGSELMKCIPVLIYLFIKLSSYQSSCFIIMAYVRKLVFNKILFSYYREVYKESAWFIKLNRNLHQKSFQIGK